MAEGRHGESGQSANGNDRKATLAAGEYYERWIRSDEQLEAAIAYVEDNPVRSGLATCPEEWRVQRAKNRRQNRRRY
jgi:hypothetical protein